MVFSVVNASHLHLPDDDLSKHTTSGPHLDATLLSLQIEILYHMEFRKYTRSLQQIIQNGGTSTADQNEQVMSMVLIQLSLFQALQIIYLHLAIFYNILIDKKAKPDLQIHLRNILRYANLSIITPVALYIIMIFWMIYTIDRDLVYPRLADEIISPYLNYSVHLLIIILPAMELFYQKSMEIPAFKIIIVCAVVFESIYFYVQVSF